MEGGGGGEAGEGAAGWEGSGSGSVLGGSTPCRPPLLGEPCVVPGGASAADALERGQLSPPKPGRSGSPPGSPHPRRAAPNPFLAESSSLAATSSSRCAAYGSRPALAQTSLGTALKLSRPGWGAPSPEVSPPCPRSPPALGWGRGLRLLGPGAACAGAACAAGCACAELTLGDTVRSALGTRWSQCGVRMRKVRRRCSWLSSAWGQCCAACPRATQRGGLWLVRGQGGSGLCTGEALLCTQSRGDVPALPETLWGGCSLCPAGLFLPHCRVRSRVPGQPCRACPSSVGSGAGLHLRVCQRSPLRCWCVGPWVEVGSPGSACLPDGPAAGERHSRCQHLCFEPCLSLVRSVAQSWWQSGPSIPLHGFPPPPCLSTRQTCILRCVFLEGKLRQEGGK